MPDQAEASEGAYAHKYSDDQVAYSRNLLGREPEGADLAAHHDMPADGITGDHPDAPADLEGDS